MAGERVEKHSCAIRACKHGNARRVLHSMKSFVPARPCAQETQSHHAKITLALVAQINDSALSGFCAANTRPALAALVMHCDQKLETIAHVCWRAAKDSRSHSERRTRVSKRKHRGLDASTCGTNNNDKGIGIESVRKNAQFWHKSLLFSGRECYECTLELTSIDM